MTVPTAADRRGIAALALAALTTVGGLAGSSCIIPDHGIVTLVDCGSS